MPVRDTVPFGAPVWIDLSSSDQAASITFYTALLGWECEQPDPELGGYANFTLQGERVAGCVPAVGGPAMGGPTDAWAVYLATEDAEQTCSAAVAAGGALQLPPMPVGDLGAMAVVADPSGVSFGLWQPGTHRGLLTTAEPGHAAWFELASAQHEQTLQFGREVFGWQTSSVADSPEFTYSTASVAGEEAVGVLSTSCEALGSVYLQVQDADDAQSRAIALGATLVQDATDTPYGRVVTLTDPTGALVNLVA